MVTLKGVRLIIRKVIDGFKLSRLTSLTSSQASSMTSQVNSLKPVRLYQAVLDLKDVSGI